MSRIIMLTFTLACGGPGPDTATDDSGTTRQIVETDPYSTILPSFEWTRARIDESDGLGYRYFLPENPIGLIWVFHGRNGNTAAVLQTEWFVLYNQLAQRGIGNVITQSVDRKNGRWDTNSDPNANVDWLRIRAMFDQMVAEGVVDPDIPMLAIGFSGGSEMCATMDDLAPLEGWDLRGMAVHNGLGTRHNPTALPVFYTTGLNDETNQTPDALQALSDECATCVYRLGHEITLNPLRFVRLEGISRDTSNQLFDEVVNLGMVDADGERLVDISTEKGVESAMATWLATSRLGASLPAQQLRVVWATHRLSSEHATEETDFLLDLVEP